MSLFLVFQATVTHFWWIVSFLLGLKTSNRSYFFPFRLLVFQYYGRNLCYQLLLLSSRAALLFWLHLLHSCQKLGTALAKYLLLITWLSGSLRVKEKETCTSVPPLQSTTAGICSPSDFLQVDNFTIFQEQKLTFPTICQAVELDAALPIEITVQL